MSEYINRQAVLSLAKDVTLEGGAKHRCVDATEICLLPSADVVEVVRCNDCKHADEYYHCIFSTIWNDKNHYCGKGERRNG